MVGDQRFEDRFVDSTLDTTKWFPHYLPAWSSRAETPASYHLDDGLVLDIPPSLPVWCAGLHEPPLRVSGIQSGTWSGPVGTYAGQQRFRDGLVVIEEQERFEGWLPGSGRVAITTRMMLSPRSMAALWLSGFEGDPDQTQCGELCVFEIFGRSLTLGPEPSAEVGVGIKPFRDPALRDDFATPRLPLDVRDLHTYAVDWDADAAVFTVDDQVVRRCAGPPTYPMQLMLAVFDFPQWSVGDDHGLIPSLYVREISGHTRIDPSISGHASAPSSMSASSEPPQASL